MTPIFLSPAIAQLSAKSTENRAVWRTCVMGAVDRLIRGQDAADLIARGAIIACNMEGTRFAMELQQDGIDAQRANKLYELSEKLLVDDAILRILEARAKR